MIDTSSVVLVVDVANVVGSRPDGWWRDRAGATARLLDQLVPLAAGDVLVTPPDGDEVRIERLIAVVEGQASRVTAPPGVDVVRATRDGDTTIVEVVTQLRAAGTPTLVVTADRGLRARLPGGAGAAVSVAGPRWLRDLL
jgi:hypothetical protein